MFDKLKAKIQTVLEAIFLSPLEKQLVHRLASFQNLERTDKVVLVQIVPDPAFILRYIFFFKAWKQLKRESFRLQGNWAGVAYSFSFPSCFRRFYNITLMNNLIVRKWSKIFKTFGVQRVYSPQFKNHSACESIARDIFAKIREPQDLLKIEYEGIALGDLVNDTYLRYRGVPKVDYKDTALIEIIAKALCLIHEYKTLFQKNRYEFYLTSYTTYIHHGVPARVALSMGIPVYAVGAYNQLFMQPTVEFSYHRRNFYKYRDWVRELPADVRSSGLRWAHECLEKRFSGQVDPATWYMKKSAFRPPTQTPFSLPEKNRQTILIMAHDFFDSPHIYGEMIYPDFYQWLDKTLAFLKTQKSEVLLKPHPNGMSQNVEVLNEFRHKYPEVVFLPPEVTVHQLAQRGIDLLVTVYGTIGHEAPYLGIPCVSAGVNPHITFDFSKTVTTEKEYFEYLSFEKKVLLPDTAKRKDQVAEYFLAHNFRSQSGRIALFPLDLSMELLVSCLDSKSEDFRRRMELAADELPRVHSI